MATQPKRPAAPWYPWIGKRPFYGWIIVIIGAVTQFFQGITSQGFSTYLGPLGTDFGWSKAALAGPRSVTQIEGAITGPIEGFLVDKFGPRRVVTVGVFIMGLGFLLFGITNSYWMFLLSSIIIALGTGLQGLLVMSVTVNNWFRRKRTISQSVMSLGYSMAGVVGVPALVFIQNQMGWRESAYITALIVWTIGFPCALLLRTVPESIGSVPDGEIPDNTVIEKNYIKDEYDFTLREAIRTRSFWLLAFGWAIGNLGLLGVQVHLFLHLEIVGLSRATVSLVWMVASLSNIPSRLIGGFLGDRLQKNVMHTVSMVFMAVAIYILAIADSPLVAFSYAVLFGIGWGMRTPIINAIQGEYFGRKSQGIIRGWLQTISLPIIIAAPVVAGHMADIQGTYKPTFIVIALIILAGAFLVFFATHPPIPATRR
jgi:MFS family permease